SQRISVSIVLGMVLVMVLLLAKQIITLYHAVQKTLTKDQHALIILKSLPVDRSSDMSGQRLEKEISHRGGYIQMLIGHFL
ncbi:hypothetical protein, partial [Vibrio splendidus]|uniref:hypothetical protein n=1 Tax=Vibrio splendidus TaxID=29497 RepID=UPI002468E38B